MSQSATNFGLFNKLSDLVYLHMGKLSGLIKTFLTQGPVCITKESYCQRGENFYHCFISLFSYMCISVPFTQLAFCAIL